MAGERLQGIILAGGKGERFWPVSREQRPKQLLRLFGQESLLQATWRRLRLRLAPDALRVLTGADLAAAVRAELPELAGEHLVLESIGRNTAPALAAAAALGVRDGSDPLQLVVPSDHWIPDAAAFWACVDHAVTAAAGPERPLVTFGVTLTRPDTGYGYIERGAPRGPGERIWEVRRFHEKPDRNTAERYLRAGDFFWNSGIFLWHARSFLRELERAMPELAVLVAELQAARDPRAFLPEFFRRAPAQSVDYGVLEESRRVVVVAAEFAWSDVGTWERWADLMPADDGENVRAGEVTSVESRGCVFFAEGGRVAALGVEDLVVVHTPQATLVLPKARSHEVRAILRALEHRGDRPR